MVVRDKFFVTFFFSAPVAFFLTGLIAFFTDDDFFAIAPLLNPLSDKRKCTVGSTLSQSLFHIRPQLAQQILVKARAARQFDPAQSLRHPHIKNPPHPT